MGKNQPEPSTAGWQAGAGVGGMVLEWVGWWGAGSWVGWSENVSSQQSPRQGQHPPEGSHKI